MSVFFSYWKIVFKQSRQLLDTSRHLAYLSSTLAYFNRNLNSFSIASRSIKKVSVSSIAARQLLNPSSLFLMWTPLDSCSIAVSLHAFKALHLSTPFDLSRIMKFLYIRASRFRSHFFDFSRQFLSFLTPKLFKLKPLTFHTWSSA